MARLTGIAQIGEFFWELFSGVIFLGRYLQASLFKSSAFAQSCLHP
ncbi:unnamed protein product [Schistosoma curassoni]|uniref:BH4_AAA_HYDROXYL_2 domain-containing protein n=1 Tax=Schistosoma curassoni TaxID=6186 RepID=A0A183K4D8_9TREM|nr:unnamed protein product [Schistosoma curassoni]